MSENYEAKIPKVVPNKNTGLTPEPAADATVKTNNKEESQAQE
jgi:hypothetical protein